MYILYNVFFKYFSIALLIILHLCHYYFIIYYFITYCTIFFFRILFFRFDPLCPRIITDRYDCFQESG